MSQKTEINVTKNRITEIIKEHGECGMVSLQLILKKCNIINAVALQEYIKTSNVFFIVYPVKKHNLRHRKHNQIFVGIISKCE